MCLEAKFYIFLEFFYYFFRFIENHHFQTNLEHKKQRFSINSKKNSKKNKKFGLQTHINMENRMNGLDQLFGLWIRWFIVQCTKMPIHCNVCLTLSLSLSLSLSLFWKSSQRLRSREGESNSRPLGITTLGHFPSQLCYWIEYEETFLFDIHIKLKKN